SSLLHSDNVRKGSLRFPKINRADDQQKHGNSYRAAQQAPVQATRGEQRPTESFQKPGHGIESEKRLHSSGQEVSRINDGGYEQPHLNDEGQRIFDVAI